MKKASKSLKIHKEERSRLMRSQRCVGLLGQVIGIAKKKSRAISVTTQY